MATIVVNGVRTSEVRYIPFADQMLASGTTPTTFRFTGQRQEQSLGIYYYGARWYDSYLNRWIQPDSIIPDPNNPLDWDRYSYVQNNPVRYVDPSGHMLSECGLDNQDCNAKEGEEYSDYVYNVIHNEEERRENTEKVETASQVLGIAVSIISEPIDWTLTIGECLGGDCSPWAVLGLLPLVPGSKVDDIVAAVKNMDGAELAVDDALNLATQFLGKDYLDMGNGRFLSADGLRQVRMGDGDILGLHGGGPHINFDLLGPNPAKLGTYTQTYPSIHVFLFGR